MSMVSAGIAFAGAATLAGRLPIETIIVLWRPIELFSSRFTFTVDSTVWPIFLLASATVFAEALLDGRSTVRLLYSGIGLAAIAGGNLLTIAMLWTVMIVLETALRLKNSNELEAATRKAAVQLIAVAAILAAVTVGESAVTLLALAALFRSVGGADERFPFSLAIMPALGALAVISRSSLDASIYSWIAAGAIAIALVQSLLFIPRLSSLALALIAAGLMVPPEAQAVAWTSLAVVLVATLGLSQAGGSRIAWIAVAIIPSAFLSAAWDPGLFLITTLATMALVIISRWLPLASRAWPPSRVEAAAITVLMIPTIWALLSSGWLPNLAGALSAAVGMAVGYAIARSWPVLSQMLRPARPLLEEVRQAGRAVSETLATSVRTIANVLEGRERCALDSACSPNRDCGAAGCDCMNWIPLVLVAVTAFALIVVERPGLQIAILATQYASVAWLSSLALPPQVAVVKVVAGMITCGVLALTVAGSQSSDESSSGRAFRVIAAILIMGAAIGVGRTNWMRIPDIRPEAIMAAAILMSMGLLQLGLFRTPLRVCIGLITVLSGFEIAYAVIEPALAILALLASVHIGLAMVVSYLTLVARQSGLAEGGE